MLLRVSVEPDTAPDAMPPASAAGIAPQTSSEAGTTGSAAGETTSPGPPPIETASIEQFLAGIGPRAFRFAELGLRDRDDALDAVQDAMIRMLGYRDRPAMEWTPLFWSVLRSRVVDLQRRRAFRMRWLAPSPNDNDEPVDWADRATPDPARAQDSREAFGRLADALATLPRRQREAFALRVLEELDVATTARIMGCGEGAVKTHLFRAREALRHHLRDWQ